jgi:hypothetical protein
MLNRNP